MVNAVRIIGSFVLLTILSATDVEAVSVWNNAGGGLYSSPGNWTGGVPVSGSAVTYNVNGTYTVNVDVAANHGATQFSATNANVTLNITAPGYTIPSTVKIGGATGTNNVAVSGGNFDPTNVEIAPTPGGTGSLTLSGPMHSSVIAVGGKIAVNGSGDISQVRGDVGTLTLNPGADLTVSTLLSDNEQYGSQIVFNGGTLTILGPGRFNGYGQSFTQVGDGTHAATLNLLSVAVNNNYEFNYETLTIANNATVNYNNPNGNLSVGNIVRDSSGATPGVFNWVSGCLTFQLDWNIEQDGPIGGNVILTPGRTLQSYGNTAVKSGATLSVAGGAVYLHTYSQAPGGTTTYSHGTFYVENGGLEIGPNGLTNPGRISLDSMDDWIGIPNGELTIANGHSVSLNAGTLTAKTLVNHGLLSLNGGSLALAGPLSIGPTGQLNNSPNFVLGAGSQIYDYLGDVTIEPTQVVTLNGGAITAKQLINNGTLYYNSGIVSLGGGDLTIGPTGQFRLNPVMTLEGGFSAGSGVITVQAGQTINFSSSGGGLGANTVAIDGSVNVPNGSINAVDSIVMGSTGQLTLSNQGSLGAHAIIRTNMIVSGGTIYVPTLAPLANNPHNTSLTVTGGSIYTTDMSIGAMSGYVDTVTVDGGHLQAVNLIANGGSSSAIIFNSGELYTTHAEVDGPSTFVVGNGSAPARLLFYGADDSTHSFADGIEISTSGELDGEGIISGNIVNNGKLSPGQFTYHGRLTVTDSLVSTGVVRLDLESFTYYDQLQVDGNFNAAGVIAVNLGAHITPTVGTTFDIMDIANFTDSGYLLDLTGAQLAPGRRWDISQLQVDGTIRVVAGYTGDFNADGKVDSADYVVWRKGLRVVYTSNDFNTWRSQLGLNAGSGTGLEQLASVPEPASVALLLIGILAVGSRRRGVTTAA